MHPKAGENGFRNNGSVTFNQVGRDLPYGGINEAGLVVEHMTLEKLSTHLKITVVR